MIEIEKQLKDFGVVVSNAALKHMEERKIIWATINLSIQYRIKKMGDGVLIASSF